MIAERFDPVSNEYHAKRLAWWNENASFWSDYVKATPRHTALYGAIANDLEDLRRPFRSFLDLGCGDGTFLRRLRERRPEATLVGVDFSPQMIEVARRESDGAAMFETGDFETSELLDGQTFDCVTAILSFAEAGRLEASFRNAARLLNPGGICVVAFLDSTIDVARHTDDLPPLPDLGAQLRTGGFVYSRYFHYRNETSPAPYSRVIRLGSDYDDAARDHNLHTILQRRVWAETSAAELPPLYYISYFEKSAERS